MQNGPRRSVAGIVLLLAMIVLPAATAHAGPVGETPAQRDARMQWWRQAKFGMFIHWGIYAVPASGEWYMTDAHVPIPEYEKFAAQFNPVKFDADAIASVAEAAGQKYLVITAKHHDGFCMFKTDTTKYNVVDATPWHQDPLAALSQACKKHHVQFCCYYSIMDWHSPDQVGSKPDGDKPNYNPTHFPSPEHKQAYITYMKAQLKDLITQYHPGVIWFDGGWMNGWTREDGTDLTAYLYALDPNLIINNRTNGSKGGDYGTPEQNVPGKASDKDWETCMTINGSWGFNKGDKRFKSTHDLLDNLIDIASKGGNYLLNVGPTPEGDQPEIDRLKAMGDWLKINGDAIYGTKGSPFSKQPDWGRCTRKDNNLYLIVLNWPKDGKLTLPLQTPVNKAYFLADSSKSLTCTTVDGSITIEVPSAAPDPIASVIAVECQSEPKGK